MKMEGEISSLIEACYTHFVGRSASQSEVSLYSEAYLTGEPIGNIIEAIALDSLAVQNKPLNQYSATDSATDNWSLNNLIEYVYQLAFDRYPANNELDSWKSSFDAGLSVEDFIRSVLVSDEFNSARRRPSTEELADLVTNIYVLAFNRSPGQDEINTWISSFSAGLRVNDFVGEIVASPEFTGRRQIIDLSDLEKLVNNVYIMAFNRDADDGAIDHWVSHLSRGFPIPNFIDSIVGSDEFQRQRKSQEADEIARFVKNVYLLAFNRAPEQRETDTWVTNFSAGLHVNDFVREIVASAEFNDRRQATGPSDLENLVINIYEMAFSRTANDDEIGHWVSHLSKGLSVSNFINVIRSSDEYIHRQDMSASLKELFSISEMVKIAYENILNRGVLISDLESISEAIRRGELTWSGFLKRIFDQLIGELAANKIPIDARQVWVPTLHLLGSRKRIVPSYQSTAPTEIKEERNAVKALRINSIEPHICVSAIASMYKGKKFIRKFLDNITSQSIFSEFCELIIVDACSPEQEFEIIKPYMERFPNIIYHRADSRIGIYDAWNVGIKMSRGKYITNTNLDDIRRVDSFEVQMAGFERVGIPDIIYQDFYYTFDEGLNFDEVEAVGTLCRLPIVNIAGLMAFNSPHNAPMWRRSLHDEVGWFDDRYRSAGDCDFWLRCAVAGKTFYKLNDPHVGYYWNPGGLSTHGESLGVAEHRDILKRLSAELIAPELLQPYESFRDSLKLAVSVPAKHTSRYELLQLKLLSLALDSGSSEPIVGTELL